ncbi:MAG: hypothetical protein HGA22_11730 [Clostridiales bacterium]|nr:hypothetical protein [Clostridiales bacterium]
MRFYQVKQAIACYFILKKGNDLMFEKMKKPLFWAGVIGAVKLATDAFGITLISNEQVNVIADGLAAIVTVAGVVVSHDKAVEKSQ